ncbi:hypothetical protein MNBD_GAMMA13-481 [hydrothermal vent metagenome]|uniref:Uncharacterized protein n=1 Tax=hydrothermal vent metagenome TaxID=652676 RepID=A0A3B0YXM8_9ZZZZ
MRKKLLNISVLALCVLSVNPVAIVTFGDIATGDRTGIQ